MQSCSHTQAANSKECSLCRVKRAVCIEQRTPTLHKVPRHGSKKSLTALPTNYPHFSLQKKQKTAYQDSFLFTETHYSRWIKRM
jgi:hypothetical protein